jgi:hypothetical protein
MRVFLPIATLGFQCTTFSNFILLRVFSSSPSGNNTLINLMIGALFYSFIGFLMANLSIERYMTLLRIKRDNWKYWAIMGFQFVVIVSCAGTIGFRILTLINPASFAAKAGNSLFAAMGSLIVCFADMVCNIAMGKVVERESR